MGYIYAWVVMVVSASSVLGSMEVVCAGLVVFQASRSAWILIGQHEVEAAWAVSGWLVAAQLTYFYSVWEHDLLQWSAQPGHLLLLLLFIH
jgi:hypothetical protein